MVEKKKTTKAASGREEAREGGAEGPREGGGREARGASRPPRRPPVPRRSRRRRPPAPSRPPALGVHSLGPAPGSTHYRKRVGRGPGSGHGKTAGRGSKGQKSSTGYRHQRGFEGGQMPLHRRLPKRGFTNIFRVEYDIVNISDLDRFDAGAAVNPEMLAASRLTRKNRLIKILGDGEIKKALTVSAHKFSASAKASIEAAGGRCEVLSR